MTRRTLLGAAALTAVAQAARRDWQPKLGALGPYTPANLEFSRTEGFTNMILGLGSTLDPMHITDEQIASVKANIQRSGLHISALQATQQHIAADSAQRERENAFFVKVIELAGKLGVPYVGTASGNNPALPFREQVDQIIRVYTDRYFPACQKSNVRILWEPWPGGPNIATGPVGFEALLRGFNDSPYVGLQYDPSHLVWQFMDPIQAARDFIKYIYDVHLKDTEILWPVLRRAGIHPVDNSSWWRYRLPGLGSINWAEFFSVFQEFGYQGAMTIEHEDPFYGCCSGPEFSEDFKRGFHMAHRYLRQYIPDRDASPA